MAEGAGVRPPLSVSISYLYLRLDFVILCTIRIEYLDRSTNSFSGGIIYELAGNCRNH